MDFGSNPAAADTSTTRRGKREEQNYGLITVELPNGQKLDGYILLPEKNLGKMGLTVEKAKGFGQEVKTISGGKLHVQFGDRQIKIAEEVTFD